MSSALLETARSLVAMEALPVIVGRVQLDLVRHLPKILDVDMPEPAQLCLVISKHRVISVTGETGLVPRHSIVLIVRRRQERGIVYAKALAVVRHCVTGQAKFRPFRALHVL